MFLLLLNDPLENPEEEDPENDLLENPEEEDPERNVYMVLR